MANKANFGEWGAFDSGRGVRFQKTINGKKTLVKEADVPVEVAALLKKNLGIPTAEAKLTERFETPKVIPIKEDNTPDMSADDFEDENELPRTDEPVLVSEIVSEITAHAQKSPEFHEGYAEASEAMSPSVDASFLEQISIHTASLEDIAHALYERFGIYTVYLNRYPQPDEVNPFTAEPMTNYERGVAYQAALRSEARGLTRRPPELLKKQLDDNLEAANNIRKSYAPVPQDLDEAKKLNSFDYRTSVESTHDNDLPPLEHYVDEYGVTQVRRSETVNGTSQRNADPDYKDHVDEPIVEPRMGGGQIIRPNW